MNKNFTCCQECYDVLREKSSQTADLWMLLCKYRLIEGNIIHCFIPELPELRILENLGFIVTTEKEDIIAVKVRGYLLSVDGEPFFCSKDGNHGSV